VLEKVELGELVRACGITLESIRGYYWVNNSQDSQSADSLISLTSDNKNDTDSQGDSRTWSQGPSPLAPQTNSFE
jgi:hypothetical protein